MITKSRIGNYLEERGDRPFVAGEKIPPELGLAMNASVEMTNLMYEIQAARRKLAAVDRLRTEWDRWSKVTAGPTYATLLQGALDA